MRRTARTALLSSVAVVAVVGFGAAASGAGASGTAPSSVGATPSPTDVAERPPADVDLDGPIEVSDAGHVVKDLGEPGGLTVAGAETAYFEITVLDVAVVTACPGRGVALPPANGYFVVLDVTASMRSDIDEVVDGGADLFMPLAADAFRVLAPDGSATGQTLTDASWSCYSDAELAPPFVGPGETATGKVVLDSAAGRGTLVYAPGGAAGWEWAFE